MTRRWRWPLVWRSTLERETQRAEAQGWKRGAASEREGWAILNESFKRLVSENTRLRPYRDCERLGLNVEINADLFGTQYSADSRHIARYLADRVEQEFATMRFIPRPR